MQLRGERLGDRKEEEESGGKGRVREKRRWEGRRGEGRGGKGKAGNDQWLDKWVGSGQRIAGMIEESQQNRREISGSVMLCLIPSYLSLESVSLSYAHH